MLVLVAALWLMAVVAPGPNLIATLAAARTSRRAALLTVLGIGVGTACWGLAGSLGLQALFTAAPWLFLALKLVGGAYLIITGLRLLRTAARNPTASTPPTHPGKPALTGLATSLSNPKSALLVTSLFAATLPPGAPLRFGLAATAIMVTISLAWYGLVACLATGPAVAQLLGTTRRWIDAAAGLAFATFGLRLILTAR